MSRVAERPLGVWRLALMALALPGTTSAVPGAAPISSGVTVASFSGIDTSTNNPPDLTIAVGPERLAVSSNGDRSQ